MAKSRDGPLRAAALFVQEGGMDEREILHRIEQLRSEHRDLDAAIGALLAMGGDQLQIARLKKRKLMLKDEIAQLEDRLIPDIIA
jgi:hypothetical protein